MRRWIRAAKEDYRHIITLAIAVICVAFGVLFHHALPRLGEAFYNLAISVAYYCCELFTENNPIVPTANNLPSWQFAPSYFEPLSIFPWTFDEFKVVFANFGHNLFSREVFFAWWMKLTDIFYYASKGLLIVMPLVILVILFLRRYTNTENHDNDVDSKPLALWRKFVFRVAYPVRDWLRAFRVFLREHPWYMRVCVFLWLLYFNIFTLFVEFISFYLYFVVSFDLLGIYSQVVKLMHDMSPMMRFIPKVIWVLIGIVVFNRLCEKMARDRLYRNEHRNAAFVESSGVVTTIYGPMGTGKTALLTSLALTAEVKFRNDALEILIERDMMFPDFPWCNLRTEIRKALEAHTIVDITSAKRWVRLGEERYRLALEEGATEDPLGYDNFLFGYKEEYPLVYDGELGRVTIWDAIEDYACAFLIYNIQTTYLMANYSIRTDQILDDIGNMPLWDSDFFRRDAKLMDAYSRYAHIIDFDMLRLGRRMLAENPMRNAFGFGVYCISEIDKERKNCLELRETKRNTNECNQNNDLFNATLKMARHACVIANRVFLKIFCDLQRPEDWGAGGREVGEVVCIARKGAMAPTLPFFSTFWFTEPIYERCRAKFDSFYLRYIHNRADNTLLVHLLKGIMAKLAKHYGRINDLYGTQPLHLEMESGRLDGEIVKTVYYRMPKKDFARRYSTNCLSAIFEGDAPNALSVDDFVSYAGIMATADELERQNSHFQSDLKKRKKIYSEE